MVMTMIISKAQFKPKVLAWLRQVEETGEDLVITDHGRPSVRIVPAGLASLETVQAQWKDRVAEGSVRYEAEAGVEPLPPEAWGELGQP